MNILVIASDRTGVSKYRSIDQHIRLQELYKDSVNVDIITAGTDTIDLSNIEYLKKYQIIHFHRNLFKIINNQVTPIYGKDVENIIAPLKKLGIKIVMDIDDYWSPTEDHPLFSVILDAKLHILIPETLKVVDYITTTTPIFAEKIKNYNKNVVVLPNAINPDEKQFIINDKSTKERLSFGWLGGSSHLYDLDILYPLFNRLKFYPELKEKLQFVLCGFDTRGTITYLNEKNEKTQRKIKPHETVWSKYENIFTNNHNLITKEESKILKKYNKELYYDDLDSFYRRIWTKPITSYATNYNNFKISLAPIKEHDFNKYKSQLKVIEAGMFGKGLIATNFGPYTIDLIHEENCLLVDSKDNNRGWFEAIKKLYENPDLLEKISYNLQKTVLEKYHIDVVVKNRYEFYKNIIDGHK
jgi:glycosyltransferase involved in cell wall biosynthesis